MEGEEIKFALNCFCEIPVWKVPACLFINGQKGSLKDLG